MSDNKQRILAVTGFDAAGDMAVQHGLKIAEFSDKALSILHVPDSTEAEQRAREDMQKVTNRLASRHSIATDGYVLKGDPRELIHRVAAKMSATMIILGQQGRIKNRTLSMIRKSRVPYVVVKDMPGRDTYKNVVYPVDLSVAVKEKALWAVYFSKFYDATIHILTACKAGRSLSTELKNNLLFTKGTFKRFGVDYQTHRIDDKSYNVNDHVVGFAKNIGSGLIITMMTKYPGLFDYLLGAQEKKIINNTLHIPIMCINSRDDLYVPCV